MEHKILRNALIILLLSLFVLMMSSGKRASSYYGISATNSIYGTLGSCYLGGLGFYGGLYGMYGGVFGGVLDLGMTTLLSPLDYYSFGGMFNLLNTFDPLGDPLLGFGMLSMEFL